MITILGYIYTVQQKMTRLELAAELYDEKLETLKLKYDTSDMIRKAESDIKILSAESKAEKEYVREHIYNIINMLNDRSDSIDARCKKIESSIKSSEDECS